MLRGQAACGRSADLLVDGAKARHVRRCEGDGAGRRRDRALAPHHTVAPWSGRRGHTLSPRRSGGSGSSSAAVTSSRACNPINFSGARLFWVESYGRGWGQGLVGVGVGVLASGPSIHWTMPPDDTKLCPGGDYADLQNGHDTGSALSIGHTVRAWVRLRQLMRMLMAIITCVHVQKAHNVAAFLA